MSSLPQPLRRPARALKAQGFDAWLLIQAATRGLSKRSKRVLVAMCGLLAVVSVALGVLSPMAGGGLGGGLMLGGLTAALLASASILGSVLWVLIRDVTVLPVSRRSDLSELVDTDDPDLVFVARRAQLVLPDSVPLEDNTKKPGDPRDLAMAMASELVAGEGLTLLVPHRVAPAGMQRASERLMRQLGAGEQVGRVNRRGLSKGIKLTALVAGLLVLWAMRGTILGLIVSAVLLLVCFWAGRLYLGYMGNGSFVLSGRKPGMVRRVAWWSTKAAGRRTARAFREEPLERKVKADLDVAAVASINAIKAKASSVTHWEAQAYLVAWGPVASQRELEAMVDEAALRLSSTMQGPTGQQLAWIEAKPMAALSGVLDPDVRRNMVLSSSELAALTSALDANTQPAGVKPIRSLFREMAPTAQLSLNDDLVGVTEDGREHSGVPLGLIRQGAKADQLVGVACENLDKHMFIAGSTGSGKSVFIENLFHGIVSDPMNPCVIMLDPHGTLVEAAIRIVAALAPERLSDVLVADFGNPEHPVSWNPLDVSEASSADVGRICEAICEEAGLSETQLPRAFPLFEQALIAMVAANASYLPAHAKLGISDVIDFFSDTEFRELVISHCTNPVVQRTFGPNGSFTNAGDKGQIEQAAPIIARINKLISDDSLRRSMGVPTNRFNLAGPISNRSILLIKTGGEQNKKLSAMLAKNVLLQTYALAPKYGRQSGDQDYKTDPWVRIRMILDELAQQIKTINPETIVDTLTQSRKYDFGFGGACQFTGQLPPALVDAFLNNAATKAMLLNKNPSGVKQLAAALQAPPDLSAQLEEFRGAFSTVMPNGSGSGTFTAKLPGPIKTPKLEESAESALVERSRAAFSLPKAEADRLILNHPVVVRAALRGTSAAPSEVAAPGGQATPAPEAVGGTAPASPVLVDDEFDDLFG